MDFDEFNQGEYLDSAAPKTLAEELDNFLYPTDNYEDGKELRLRHSTSPAAPRSGTLRSFTKMHPG